MWQPSWGQIETALAKATAYRDIAVISGAYTHAQKADDFNYRSKFGTFDEAGSVREGFLLQHEYHALECVIAEMGSEYLWLRGLTKMAYECGNRKGGVAEVEGECHRLPTPHRVPESPRY